MEKICGNLLNIGHSADRWQGAREEQTDKSFVQFTTMAYGYRAAWKVLESYWHHFHLSRQPYTPAPVRPKNVPCPTTFWCGTSTAIGHPAHRNLFDIRQKKGLLPLKRGLKFCNVGIFSYFYRVNWIKT